MGSIFFSFYYDDGTNRPFDPDVALDADTSAYEVTEVTADGLIDIFELRPEELDAMQLTAPHFKSSFIVAFDEDSIEPGPGVDANVYGETMTLPVVPAELEQWATAWFEYLSGLSEEEIQDVLIYNGKYAAETVYSLGRLVEQAQCAQEHNVGIMLFVSW